MKLQFRSVKELSGRTKLWYRSRRVYTHAGFVCRSPYRTCEWLARICENRSLSDFSQRAANVGESSEQNPDRMLLLKTPSSRSRSEAFVKPHQAGDAYNNRERIIDLNTWSRPSLFSPCARRVLRANIPRAQVDTVFYIYGIERIMKGPFFWNSGARSQVSPGQFASGSEVELHHDSKLYI